MGVDFEAAIFQNRPCFFFTNVSVLVTGYYIFVTVKCGKTGNGALSLETFLNLMYF